MHIAESKQGGIAAFIDAEHALMVYAKKIELM
jgi:RecA/RadA recombinase